MAAVGTVSPLMNITTGGYTTATISGGGGGGVGAITLTSTGTGYTSTTTPYITVSGGGTGYANQVLTTNTGGATSWTGIGGKEVMRISADGDIFQGGSSNADDGVFARLERLERLMGIMRRDRSLESDYEPMRQLGDAYDDAVDAAISAIMEVTLGKLRHMEQEYENMREQAKVWRALSKDDD